MNHKPNRTKLNFGSAPIDDKMTLLPVLNASAAVLPMLV